jgi:hypothetical protein
MGGLSSPPVAGCRLDDVGPGAPPLRPEIDSWDHSSSAGWSVLIQGMRRWSPTKLNLLLSASPGWTRGRLTGWPTALHAFIRSGSAADDSIATWGGRERSSSGHRKWDPLVIGSGQAATRSD